MKFNFALAIIFCIFLIGCASTSTRSYASNSAIQKIDGLYVNTYGNQADPSMIFIHGGPGYDSQDFEWSTASALATKGYYVVVYDQRGQGRSDVAKDPNEYSYQQYADDIKLIISQLNLHRPVLVGHSHGGQIALKFDQIYPGVISKIILVSAPIDFWKSLNSIKTNCTERYKLVNDTENIEKLDAAFLTLNSNPSLKDEIMATAEIFQLGSSKPCYLYTPKSPNSNANDLRKEIKGKHVPVVHENLFYPMGNFIINEQYIHVDQTEWVKAQADHIFGIYGNEDGLFTPAVLREIQTALSENTSPYTFQQINGASHAVYIDQQDIFIKALVNTLK